LHRATSYLDRPLAGLYIVVDDKTPGFNYLFGKSSLATGNSPQVLRGAGRRRPGPGALAAARIIPEDHVRGRGTGCRRGATARPWNLHEALAGCRLVVLRLVGAARELTQAAAGPDQPSLAAFWPKMPLEMIFTDLGTSYERVIVGPTTRRLTPTRPSAFCMTSASPTRHAGPSRHDRPARRATNPRHRTCQRTGAEGSRRFRPQQIHRPAT
jgi:hypothetical protein